MTRSSPNFSPHASRSCPIYLFYAAPPALGEEQRDPTHTANFGLELQERLRAAGVRSELVYPEAPDVRHPAVADFLIATLGAPFR